MTDEMIVEKFLRRDETAIGETAILYGTRLNRLAFRITGDSGTAEECENDTYLRAWNSIPPQEPRRYLFAFLAAITRHLALDRVRAANREKRGGSLAMLTEELTQCVPGGEDPAERLETAELGERINEYLRTLPSERCDVFLRRYWYFDSVAEIAARYHMTESKVTSALYRTRKGLRAYLEKEGYRL